MQNVVFKRPSECTPVELSEFENLVREGSEVHPIGLADRIRHAYFLGFATSDGNIVGIGALKIPAKSHRDSIAANSGISLPEEKYPFEIGWLFVKETERGNRFGRRLMDGLIEAAGVSGLYGTSRLDEMHRQIHGALEKRGFIRVGNSYPSFDGKTVILLFIRNPFA